MICYYCGRELPPSSAYAVQTWFGSAYCCKACYLKWKDVAQ